MKRSKKFAALLMSAALVLSTAACGGGGSSTAGTPDASKAEGSKSGTVSSEGAAVSTAAEGSDWFEGKDFSEKQVISLASVQIEDGRDYNAGDDLVKWWSEKFNIEWEITSLTFENWAERLRIWINSDDMPDMCVWNYVHGEAQNYADQGLVKMLPEGWEDKYPALAKAQGDSPMSEKAEESFGGTYYLFRPIYSNNRPTEKLATHMSLYLRKDWGEAAGVDVKKTMTISEVMDYAAKVKAADPGNLGSSFYPIVNTSGRLGQFIQANSTYSGIQGLPFYQGEDGKYQWGAASDDTLQALKLLSKAYQDGLIDPEFYTIQDPDDFGRFYTAGKSAACVGDGIVSRLQEFDQHMKGDLGLDFEDAVEVVTLLGEDGNFHGVPLTNYWGVNMFSPHISDEKLDRVLSILDYSCTDEGQLMIRCGIEGIDWERDDNGVITSNLGENESLWDKYAVMPLYVNMMVLSDDFQFQNPTYKQSLRDTAKEIHVLHERNSTEESFPAEPDWTVNLYDSQALNLASMTYGDEYAALIVKDGDIEANWKAWVDEKMPIIQPVLDELNASARN